MLSKAIKLATELYDGKTRADTGLPSILHPLAVLTHLKDCNHDEYKVPEYVLAASVLCDLVENADLPMTTIETLFDKDIQNLVAELMLDKKEIELGETKYWFEKVLKLSDNALMIKLCNMLEILKSMKLMSIEARYNCNEHNRRVINFIQDRCELSYAHISIIDRIDMYIFEN
jgi:(p)ppGpp synthase/HD superfamily hydrolase